MFDLLSGVVLGLLAGWLTSKIMRGPGRHVVMDVVLGIAVVGGWIMCAVGLQSRSAMIFTIAVVTGCAVILTLLYCLIIGNHTRRRRKWRSWNRVVSDKFLN